MNILITGEGLPPDLLVVAIEYSGAWPRRGHGGIADAYTYNGEWVNLPPKVVVDRWFYIPEREE